MKKYTQQEFLEKCSERHNWKYDYSHTVYNGITNKITIICPIHGEFEQSAHKHLCGDGCPKCGAKLVGKKHNERARSLFLSRLYNIFGDKYDFSESEYVTAKTKVKIICHCKDINGNEHGEFYTSPTNLLSGYGCPKCGVVDGIIKKREHTYEDYQKLIDNFYGKSIYVVDEYSYKHDITNIKIHCNIHNHNFFIPNTRCFPRYRKYVCPLCLKDDNVSHLHKYVKQLTQPNLEEEILEKILNKEEVWVPVKLYEKEYIISSNGRLKKINRTSKNGRRLPDLLCKESVDKRSKRRVSVCLNGKQWSLHKVVYQSFYNIIIPKGYKYTIDHIDCNPLNNSILNLRLCAGIKDNVINNPITMRNRYFSKSSLGQKMLTDIKNIEGEMWVDCVGYEDLYLVSNYGRIKAKERIIIEKNTGIKRIKKTHLMRQHLFDNMYYRIGLVDLNNKRKTHYVHRLIYESFFGKIKPGNEVDHIDSNPQNNNLENLRECTHLENVNNPNSIQKRKHII